MSNISADCFDYDDYYTQLETYSSEPHSLDQDMDSYEFIQNSCPDNPYFGNWLTALPPNGGFFLLCSL